MGRSGGYCFKIIACGGSSESVDRDDLDASSENKATPDKRGWSFRKKSAGHQVLRNTVITETPSYDDDKKSSEPVIINSEPPVTFSESEKTSANQWTEEFSRVSTSNTKDNNNTVSNLVTKDDDDDIKSDSSIDESSIIVIQTAVRKFLAERELVRIKNVVKLQAVVRGHMVRCHAAGALHCIQAIVKMQALVRARVSAKTLSPGEKGIQSSNTKPHHTYISIEKLLSNRFANQLLESTPRPKQINIKCDPSKHDSTWKWLQKWTSISSPEIKPDETNPLTLTTGSTSPETTTTEAEPPKRPAKRAATDQADSDGRKSVFGSRKASNPSFIAAQSKFEELTLTSTSTSKTTEPPAKTGSPVAYESLKVGRTAGSECGTELSVTSMLDSPDPSESEHTTEPKPLNTESTQSVEEHDLLGTELTHSILILPESYNTNQMTKSPPQPKPESSPIESEQTPSNTNARVDKRVSNEKPKLRSNYSNSKKLSPVSRGSLEISHSNNRRNSFGSQSSEIEVEGRDSSSYSYNSNCIPSYMQVTESARAKALNSSPRLSPDVQGKEAYMKKRHSMPGALNGNRHGSPRLKRASPQGSQQTTKERKWQN